MAPGDRVLLIDDLIATGGTVVAGCDLVKGRGGVVVECACMIELGVLNGRAKVAAAHPDVPVWSMISEKVLTLNGVTGKDEQQD